MKKLNIYRAERSEPIGKRSRSAHYKKSFLIILIMALLLSACGSVATPTAIPTISLDGDNPTTNRQTSDANSVTVSAVIVPVNYVDLAFAAAGRVTTVNVKVG